MSRLLVPRRHGKDHAVALVNAALRERRFVALNFAGLQPGETPSVAIDIDRPGPDGKPIRFRIRYG